MRKTVSSTLSTKSTVSILSTFARALELAGLAGMLRATDASYTVFAPSNEAFERLGANTLENILDDPDFLEAILLYHLVSGRKTLCRKA
jgi:uncharacterized surface protein with fasciclin (FAS1) repeats